MEFMMRMRIEYRATRIIGALTPWAHRSADLPWPAATEWEPPLPPPREQGFPVWILHHRGRELVFVSPEEMRHAADILGRRILPSARRLGQPFRAVNSHWLSRLHRSWKPWKVRQQVVKRLQAAIYAAQR